MVKVLANKVLAFDRGEKDRDGRLVTEKTKIGFCELPDWVAGTDYFKAAVADGSIKEFTSASESETVLKEMEKLEAIKAEIATLEEKRDLLSGGDGMQDPATDEDKPDSGPDKKNKAKAK